MIRGDLRVWTIAAILLLGSGAEARSRVLLLGDSNMLGFFGRKLQARLVAEGHAVTRIAKHSSGLVFPDYFDWIEQGPILADQFDADVVVIIFGGNDAQSMKPKVWDGWTSRIAWEDETAWSDEYRSRLRDLADGLRGTHRRLVVMSPTNRRSPKFRERMARIMRLQREVLDARSRTAWIDTFSMSSNADGLYLATGMDERGRFVKYRRKDGIHLTEAGAELLVDRVWPTLLRVAFEPFRH